MRILSLGSRPTCFASLALFLATPAQADTLIDNVNGITLDYGDRGRTAVHRLLDEAHAAGLIPAVTVEFAM